MWFWIPEGRDAVLGGLRRATIEKTDDGGSQQFVDVRGMAAERFSTIYRAQPHGLSSHAPRGSEGWLAALGGRSDRMLALGFEHRDYRPRDLPEGATVLYDHSGQVVSLVKKHVRIVGTDLLTIKAKDIELDGNVYLGGTKAQTTRAVSALGTVTSDGAVDVGNPLSKVWGI